MITDCWHRWLEPMCDNTATHGNSLRHTATHYNTLQHTTTRCNTTIHYNTLQHTATRCNTLQHAATHCNTLQHTATRCNTLVLIRAGVWQHCNTRQLSASQCNTLPHTTTLCDTLVQIKADVYLHDNIYPNMKIWGIKRRLTWRSWSTSLPRRYDVPTWEHIPIYINMEPLDYLYTWVYVLFCRIWSLL